jgi:hypothetical protein
LSAFGFGLVVERSGNGWWDKGAVKNTGLSKRRDEIVAVATPSTGGIAGGEHTLTSSLPR